MNGVGSSGRHRLPGTQILGHFDCSAVAIGRALGERLQADAVQLTGQAVVQLPGRPRLLRLDLFEHERQLVVGDRSPSGKQLVKHDTQAVHVCAGIDPMTFAAGLLGAHVRRSAGQARVFAEILLPQRESEVGDVGLVLRVEEDVGGFDVPVN